MFSGSHGPSRLQIQCRNMLFALSDFKQSALIRLTPHLVELELDVPPADDLLSLRLIYGEGEDMLVPMFQDFNMYNPVLTGMMVDKFLDPRDQVTND